MGVWHAAGVLADRVLANQTAGALTCVYAAKAHKSIINVMDGIGGVNIGYGAPEIVTGGRDGKCQVLSLEAGGGAVRCGARWCGAMPCSAGDV